MKRHDVWNQSRLFNSLQTKQVHKLTKIWYWNHNLEYKQFSKTYFCKIWQDIRLQSYSLEYNGKTLEILADA